MWDGRWGSLRDGQAQGCAYFGLLGTQSNARLAVGLLICCLPASLLACSCDPNLVVQPILTQGDSGLQYTVALVAAQ